jgi:hypothetical protein
VRIYLHEGRSLRTVGKKNQEAVRFWRERIREILNREWDPVVGSPEDEYDRYVGKLAEMIQADRDDFALCNISNKSRAKVWGSAGLMQTGRAEWLDRSES